MLQAILKASKTLNVLNQYHIVKQNIFLKHNISLPSSALAQKLFSAANKILKPWRNCTWRYIFWKIIMLQFDKIIINIKDYWIFANIMVYYIYIT